MGAIGAGSTRDPPRYLMRTSRLKAHLGRAATRAHAG
jgi:hypothetical protein